MFKKLKLIALLIALVLLGGFGVHHVLAQDASDSGAVTSLPVSTDATSGTTSCYIKIDGIPGEATAKGHENEINVLSYTLGASQPNIQLRGGLGSAAGRTQFQDLSFTKNVDKASPKLFLALASGQRISSAVLTCERLNADVPFQFLKWTLSNILVSSIKQSESGNDYPTEDVSLNFTKIQETYTQQSSAGDVTTPIQTGWDLSKNQSL